jgi:hypothetical protein
MDASELVAVDLGYVNPETKLPWPYHLRYSMGGVKRLKQKSGKSFLRGEALQIDEEYLPDLIYEGLVENKEALAKEFGLPYRPITIAELEERVDLKRLPDVIRAFVAVIQDAFPAPVVGDDPTKASPASAG